MKNLLTNRKQSDIINKLFRKKRQPIKSGLDDLKRNSKINFENLLTNQKRCDIIEKLVKASKTPISHRNELRWFEKNSEKS